MASLFPLRPARHAGSDTVGAWSHDDARPATAVRSPGFAPPRRSRLGAATAVVAAAAVTTLGAKALAIPLAAAVAVFFLREPLALLTLFVWVGLFKDEAGLKALPFDATFVLGILLAAVCFYRFARARTGRVPFGLVAPLAVLAAMLIISLGWTPASGYGAEKAIRFVTLTMLATVAPFCLIEDARDLRRLFLWTIVLASVTAAMARWPTLAGADRPARAGRRGEHDRGLAAPVRRRRDPAAGRPRRAGLGALVVGRRWCLPRLHRGGRRVARPGPQPDHRAPGWAAAAWSLRVPRKVVPILLIVAAGLVIVPSVPLPEVASQRLGRAISAPVTTLENNGRWALYRQAANLAEKQPLRGAGAGAFKSVAAPERQSYPHNMFLELFAELGIGVVLVVLAGIVALLVRLCAAPGTRSRRSRASSSTSCSASSCCCSSARSCPATSTTTGPSGRRSGWPG